MGSVRKPHSMKAPPSPLSSRPERSVVERSAVLAWKCFRTKRQLVGEYGAITNLVLLHLGHSIIGFGHGKTFRDGLNFVALGHVQHFPDHARTSSWAAGYHLLSHHQRRD